MEIKICPYCAIRVVPTHEGTCPSCRRSLDTTARHPSSDMEKVFDAAIEQVSIGEPPIVHPAPDANSENADAGANNPYASPNVASDARRVYRFTELPGQCPSCNWPFNMRLYPRRFQKKTIVFLVFSTIVALYAGGLVPVPGFTQVVTVFVLLSLGGIGMNFPKVVHLKCRRCRWSQKFLVRTRG